MWGRKYSLCGTPDFTLFGKFMISPIRYEYIILNLSVLGLMFVYGLMTDLFAWISLTALSQTYFTVKGH